MLARQVGTITYFQFSSLKLPGVYHAIFSRQGGISPPPWKSLNFGASVGDDINRVRENKERALATLKLNTDSTYDVYQVHSSDVVIAHQPLRPGEIHRKADAIITQKKGLTLMMRFADCVPILLLDPVQRAIGIVHAGWVGTVNNIVEKAIYKMIETYGSNPGDIQAGIGPSIGPDHYQVGNDVIEKIKSSFGSKAAHLIGSDQGNTYFDLWKANKLLLNEAGVKNVEISGICTACDLGSWYSHRHEKGKTGRFGAVIGLEGYL